MTNINDTYKSQLALKEHMLEGHRVSILEALLLFGVQSLTRTITAFKRDRFLIKSERVPMAKVLRRLNQYSTCEPPKELPIREIQVMEYWISK
jgi:hypothetical protein